MGRNKRKNLPWGKWERLDHAEYKASLEAAGHPRENPIVACFRNGRYEVVVEKWDDQPIGKPIIHLSIKRRDKREIKDWRDLQRIKNELVHPECEAVELYPKESQLIDTSNQFHLWCLPKDDSYGVGFLDSGRVVTNPDDASGLNADGSRQRPFEQAVEDTVPKEVREQIQKQLIESNERRAAANLNRR